MDKKDIERAITNARKNALPVFHPFCERSEKAWCPGNDAGIVATIISNTWEDIRLLSQIRNKSKNDYEKKLLFKYVIVELRSIIQLMDKLQGFIFLIINEDQENKHNGHISSEEAKELRILFKKYHLIKNKVDSDIIDIRNTIGAHRGCHPWTEIINNWDKLDPDLFLELLTFLAEIFNYIKELDIYDWIRSCDDDGSVEIICSGLEQAHIPV